MSRRYRYADYLDLPRHHGAGRSAAIGFALGVAFGAAVVFVFGFWPWW